MSKNEIKEEINKVLDRAPDEVLESILDYLKELLSIDGSRSILTNNLNTILHEDKEVLDKPSR